MKPCVMCGQPTPPKRSKCCSAHCMAELARNRTRERNRRLYQKKDGYDVVCQVCEKPFHSHTPVAKACSVDCRKEYRRRYARSYRRNPDNTEAVRKSIREGVRRFRLKDGIKEKQRAENYEWREKNPERWAFLKRRSSLNNPETSKAAHRRRKALMRGGGELPTNSVVQKRIGLFGGCCYCGEDVPLGMEHVVPLAAGGTNAEENLFGACVPCNSSKQSKPWREWFKKQVFHSPQREYMIVLATAQGG